MKAVHGRCLHSQQMQSFGLLQDENTDLVLRTGKHSIYVSNDFGISWEIMKPFAHANHRPVIRSLCAAGDHLYIGTQIHEVHGGYGCMTCKVNRFFF
ncbi:hypothetical protein BSAF29S_00061 [Bacillus safensis subsp. safensis]